MTSSDFNPQKVAREAAEQFVYEAVGPNAWSRYSEEEKEQSAALILSAAARMVRESGCQEALRLATHALPRAPYNHKVKGTTGQIANDAVRAALQSLRSLTEGKK